MHIVDILIIVAFLIATLYIGFSSGKKIKTFSDYAIGNRKFSNFAIYCTVAATCIGSTTTMGNVGKVYNIGIAQFIAQIGFSLSFIVVAMFLAGRFSNYYGCFSLGDIFYKSYGLPGKTLAGVAGFIYELLAVGVQFMAMGTAISVLTGFTYQVSLLISTGIVLIYTGRGGIRAVTFTDVLQFIVLILAIPILLIVILKQIGGFHELFAKLPHTHKTISDENLRRYLFLMIPVMLPSLAPHHTQRLLMTQDRTQSVKAYYYLSCSFLFVIVLSLFLGLGAKILLPNLPKYDQALFSLITNCLPVGIFGIAVVGILAVLMSSADSILNSGSIALINDLILPFLKHDLSDKIKLKLVRIASILIGICALIFASQCTSIFETRIIISTFWQAVILSPFYFLLFNMKISFTGLTISAFVGLTTCILWNINLKPILKIDGLFPGFLANVITVLFFYFLGGRQKVFSKEELRKMRRAEQAQIKKKLSIRDLQIHNNIFLGLCLVFLQLMPLLFDANSLTYSKLILTLINGTIAILLIFGGSLELFADKKRFQWLKLTTLFFCLPVTSAYLLLTSTENGLHVMTLLLSFIIMLLGVEANYERKMVFICGLATLITSFFYHKNNCIFCWPANFAWQHSFYLFGYVTVIFLLRSHLKILEKEKELIIYQERYNMARSLSHDLMTPLMAFHLIVGNKKTIELNEKQSQLLRGIADEMGSYIDNFIPGSWKKYAQLKPEDLSQCVLNCIEKQKILHKNLEIQLQAKETILARVDVVLLRRIINNLLNVCRCALPKDCNTIIIAIDYDSLGNVQLLLQAATGGFSAKDVKGMFMQNQELGDEVEFGISFHEFQDIVAKWHGTLEIISQNDNATIQILLPNQSNDQLILKD